MFVIEDHNGHSVLVLGSKVQLIKAVIHSSLRPSFGSYFGCSRGETDWFVRVVLENQDGSIDEHILETESYMSACFLVRQSYFASIDGAGPPGGAPDDDDVPTPRVEPVLAQTVDDDDDASNEASSTDTSDDEDSDDEDLTIPQPAASSVPSARHP